MRPVTRARRLRPSPPGAAAAGRPALARRWPLVALCLLSVLVLSAGCGERERLGPDGSDVEVTGVVEEVDASQMPVDGDGIVHVRLASGGEARIRVPAREARCPSDVQDTFVRLEAGVRIAARGEVVEARALRVCGEGHELRRLEEGEPR